MARFFAGDSAIGSISPGNSTDPGSSITSSPSPSPTGFFGEIKDKAKSVLTGVLQLPQDKTHDVGFTLGVSRACVV